MIRKLTGLYAVILIEGIALCSVASDIRASENLPKDSIIVSEDTFILFYDEPQHHYMRAFENFLKHDWKAAALEIRKGAAFMKLEAERASTDVKKELLLSAKRLEKTADDIEKGAFRSAKDLQNVFAEAEHAVAKHHYLRATEAWGEKKIKDAGHELYAAAVSLEHGFVWASQKIKTGKISVIDDARHIAGKLKKDAGWAKEGVGNAIGSLGKEIDKLGEILAGIRELKDFEGN